MTKFNFKVLDVNIVFLFVKNAVVWYYFAISAEWWNIRITTYYSIGGKVSISKKVF